MRLHRPERDSLATLPRQLALLLVMTLLASLRLLRQTFGLDTPMYIEAKSR